MLDFDTEIFIRDLQNFWIKKKVLVVHCGAHLAEELAEYKHFNFDPVIWIESAPNLIEKIEEKISKLPEHQVIEATLWSVSGEQRCLNIANNSLSSSLLPFGTHSLTYPQIEYVERVEIRTVKLDDLKIRASKDFLMVLDLQGCEFEVLLGAVNTLQKCKYVYVEVSKNGLYEGSKSWESITHLLEDYRFKLVDWQYSDHLNWGNALYMKNPPLWQSIIRLRRKIRHFISYKKNSFSRRRVYS